MRSGGGSVIMQLLYSNFWNNHTQILSNFLARNMLFLKQLPKPENPNISIQQTNLFQQGTHRTTHCADTIPYRDHSHVKKIGVPHFESVREGVKLKLNEVDLAEFDKIFSQYVRREDTKDTIGRYPCFTSVINHNLCAHTQHAPTFVITLTAVRLLFRK